MFMFSIKWFYLTFELLCFFLKMTFYRLEKNPIKSNPMKYPMNHFVENIGSKKRNKEQHQQQTALRSVSVGSE